MRSELASIRTSHQGRHKTEGFEGCHAKYQWLSARWMNIGAWPAKGAREGFWGVEKGGAGPCLRVQEGSPTVARVDGCISLDTASYHCPRLALNLPPYAAYHTYIHTTLLQCLLPERPQDLGQLCSMPCPTGTQRLGASLVWLRQPATDAQWWTELR